MLYGLGSHTYEVQEGWGQLPEGWKFGWIPAVAVDSQDRIYVTAEANARWLCSIAKATSSLRGERTSSRTHTAFSLMLKIISIVLSERCMSCINSPLTESS